jgi:hypothetical protein
MPRIASVIQKRIKSLQKLLDEKEVDSTN